MFSPLVRLLVGRLVRQLDNTRTTEWIFMKLRSEDGSLFNFVSALHHLFD